MRKVRIYLTLLLFLQVACKAAPHRVDLSSDRKAGTVDSEKEPGVVDVDPKTPGAEDLKLKTVDFVTALPRLSHRQWENAVRDLFQLSALPGLSAAFQPDPDTVIFGNDSGALLMSGVLWQDYQIAAETMADRISQDAAQVQKLIPSSAPKGEGLDRAKAIIKPLLERAFRRPLSSSDLDQVAAVYIQGKTLLPNLGTDAAGIKLLVTAILQSPFFLYRLEIGDSQSGSNATLNAYEIAARLSFALWESIPDEALIKAAANGSLLKAEGRLAEAKRMMNDPRATEILRFFHARNFGTYGFNNLAKTNAAWPQALGDTLVKESEMFFNEVVNVDKKGLNEILTANYSFVNKKTAPLYGVNVSSDTLVKTDLNPEQRSGLLTQIGFLASLSGNEESGIIRRGAYVNNDLFCTDLAAPPIPPTAEEGTKTFNTQREKVEAKTGKGTCGASCHATKINPAGYAFENYDAVGSWRTKEGTAPINAASSFAFNPESGFNFDGGVDFSKAISKKIEVHRCYVSKAMRYLLGRMENLSDLPLINELAEDSMEGLGTREIFVKILSGNHITTRTNNKK